jgi:hypothetical protein
MESILTDKILTAAARYLMSKMKSSSRTAKEKGQSNGRKKRRIISVDLHFLKNLLLENNFSCPNTGHKFVMFNTAQEYQEADTNKTVNPLLLPSADRINSDLDYVEGNIEITTLFYNNGKGNKTKEQALEALNIKINNMSNLKTQNKTINKQLLDYYMDSNDFERAEAYFQYTYGISVNDNKSSKGTKLSPTYEKNKIRANELESRAVAITSKDTTDKINVSALFKNNKGYADKYKFAGSGMATNILSNTDIKLYISNNIGSKGSSFFLSKEDCNKVK